MDIIQKVRDKRDALRIKAERAGARSKQLKEVAERRSDDANELDSILDVLCGKRPPSTFQAYIEVIQRAEKIVSGEPREATQTLSQVAGPETDHTDSHSGMPTDDPSGSGSVARMSIIDAAQFVLTDLGEDEYRHYTAIARSAIANGYSSPKADADVDAIARSFLDVIRRAPHLFSRRKRWFFRLVPETGARIADNSGELDPKSRLGVAGRVIRKAGHPLKTRAIAQKLIEEGVADQHNFKYLLNSLHNMLGRSPKFAKAGPGLWTMADMPTLLDPKQGEEVDNPDDVPDNFIPFHKKPSRVALIAKALSKPSNFAATGVKGVTIADLRNPLREMGYGIDMRDSVLYSSIQMALRSRPQYFVRESPCNSWRLTEEGVRFARGLSFDGAENNRDDDTPGMRDSSNH